MAASLPPLVETSPSSWLAAYQPKPEGTGGGPWIDRRQLLADGPDGIATAHRQVVERGAQRSAAGCYLAEWIGGSLAGNVGYALALGHVGFEVDPESVRWHRHAEGWLDAVDLSTAVAVVDRTHPWAGRADVDVVGTRDEVIARAVRAVITTIEPIIDAIRALAPVGLHGDVRPLLRRTEGRVLSRLHEHPATHRRRRNGRLLLDVPISLVGGLRAPPAQALRGTAGIRHIVEE